MTSLMQTQCYDALLVKMHQKIMRMKAAVCVAKLYRIFVTWQNYRKSMSRMVSRNTSPSMVRLRALILSMVSCAVWW